MARLLLRDLTPATAYKVQLRAVGGDSVSPWSRLFDLSTTFDTTPPDVPTWAAVGQDWVVNGDTFVATWLPVNTADPVLEPDRYQRNLDLDHYELELSNGIVSTVVRTNNTSYTLTFDQNRILFTTPQATVLARVRSVDNLNNVSAWSAQKTATNPAPPPVNSVTVTSLYEAIDVKWDPGVLPDDFKQFVVQLSTTSSSTGFTSVYSGPNTQYTHSTVMFATDHYFRVYMQDKFGTLSNTAVVSGAIRPKTSFGSDSTPPDNATGYNGTPAFDSTNQNSYVSFAWTASATSSDVEKYELRWSYDGTNFNYVTVPGDQTGVRINGIIPSASVYSAIRAVDAAGNKSGWLNATTYPIIATADTTNPPTPFAPSVVSNTMQMQVTSNGKDSLTGTMPPDVTLYEVYASTTSGFTPAASNMLGVIQAGATLTNTFDVPTTGTGTTQTWYVKIIAVDRSGNKSAASAQTTATPGLITNANIADATIQTAKIVSLNADKIVAGTGIINDITVKSKLTLGDATNVGTIESYDYTTSSGATGFQFSKTGLVIKSGAVSAGALLIQQGQNIMPPRQSSWEGNPASYGAGNGWFVYSGGAIVGINTTGGKFGPQKLGLLWSAQATNLGLWFSDSATSYNINTEAGKTYIFSLYAFTPTQHNVTLKVKWSNGTTVNVVTDQPYGDTANVPGTATRFSGVATAPAGTTGCILGWETSTQNLAASTSIDGIQVEEKIGGINTPSSWTPPGVTTIDGGLIRTGSMVSSAAAKDFNSADISGMPAWSINTTGNAQFGDVLIRGRMIIGVTNDYENSTTTVTDSDGNTTVQEDTTKMTGIGTMQSYNYVAGTSGWSIRSNGFAEFLQLKSNSISADAISAVSVDKLQPGTVSADLVIGSNFKAIDSETLYVTQKSRVGTIATLTMASSHVRQIGDKIRVKMDTADPAFDTVGKNFATITAITDTTISYTSPNGTSGTIGASAATGSVYVEGRSVRMSPEGITLLQNDGFSAIIDLPTNTLDPAYFAGNINANSISITDNFLLQGNSNLISPGSTLTLSANLKVPTTKPVATFSWDQVQTWMNNNYTAWKTGLWYDNGNYVTSNAFFGGNLMASSAAGNFVYNTGLTGPTTAQANTYGAVKAADGKWYVLVNDSTDGQWKVRRFASNGTNGGPAAYETQWVYDRSGISAFGVTATQWKYNGMTPPTIKDPVIGYGTQDGTNYYIFIARPNINGVTIVSRYTTAGVVQQDYATNITDNQALKSINVGTFDFGAGQYRWVITTGGTSFKTATNYVTAVGGTLNPSETWSSPDGQKLYGTCWNGSQFVSLGQNNRLYWHTTVGMNGSNVYYVKSSWFDGNNSRTINVSAVSGNATTTTITTPTAHGFVVGDIVYANGTLADGNVNNQYLTILTVPTTTTMTVATAYSGSVGAGGTLTNEWETFMTGSNTSSPTGAVGATTVTITRRAKFTINAGAVPPMPQPNAPDRAVFYMTNAASGAGAYYRQDNPSPSGTLTWPMPSGNPTPVFSGASSTRQAFPNATPSSIVFGTNNIAGDGTFILGPMSGLLNGKVSGSVAQISRPGYQYGGGGATVAAGVSAATIETAGPWNIPAGISRAMLSFAGGASWTANGAGSWTLQVNLDGVLTTLDLVRAHNQGVATRTPPLSYTTIVDVSSSSTISALARFSNDPGSSSVATMVPHTINVTWLPF